MAQSVEQLIRNQQVAGSSPASSSKLKDLTKFGKVFPYTLQQLFFIKPIHSHYIKDFHIEIHHQNKLRLFNVWACKELLAKSKTN